MKSAHEIIEEFDLSPHPEGGYYRELAPSDGDLAPWGTTSLPRNVTVTYFLLQQGDFSPFHRTRVDETWHLYRGGPAELHLIDQHGGYRQQFLAHDLGAGFTERFTIPAHSWAAIRPGRNVPWMLAVCVQPNRQDFAEFSMSTAQELILSFPECEPILRVLCRNV